jgi:hypothetical protein
MADSLGARLLIVLYRRKSDKDEAKRLSDYSRAPGRGSDRHNRCEGEERGRLADKKKFILPSRSVQVVRVCWPVMGRRVGGAIGSSPHNQESTMQQVRGWLLVGVVLGALVGPTARADEEKEEKVPLDKVPRAVLDAVKAKFKDAKLVSAEKETENDKVVYEINLKVNDQTVEVSVTPDGKIVCIEKTITARDLPRPVTEAIDSKYPRATIKKVEAVQKGEKVSYEVLLVTADKKTLEVVFEPQGKVLEEEKKDKKEEKKEGDKE